MCGINGIFHFASSEPIDKVILSQMRDTLSHRGPDKADLLIYAIQ
jgi:asparagine synthetase B (glutamine-hydrolysing)